MLRLISILDLTMNLAIDFEPSNEEMTIVLDDALILKASLGTHGELILNKAFQELEDEDNQVYTVLRNIVRELFELSEV